MGRSAENHSSTRAGRADGLLPGSGGPRDRGPAAVSLVVLVLVLSAGACQSMGPGRVAGDRFNYNEAIARSTNEQLLLNMIRLRYGESLTFVDVTQVITQYRREAGADIGGDLDLPGDGSVDAGANLRWSDQPTITYAPRTGAEFTSSLLTPIRPITVFAMVQADWPSEQLLRRVVRSINGVAARDRATGQWNPEFTRMLQAVEHLQDRGALGLAGRTDPKGGGEGGATAVLRFRDVELDSAGSADLDLLRRLWRLDPEVREYSLVFGVIPEAPDQIAVLTNSVYEILRDLSAYIDVPPVHLAEGWAEASLRPPPESGSPGPPVDVRVSADRPPDAFVSVQKDGWWFRIDQTDLRSKRMFSLVNILLQLSEAGERASAPLLTIGTGG